MTIRYRDLASSPGIGRRSDAPMAPRPRADPRAGVCPSTGPIRRPVPRAAVRGPRQVGVREAKEWTSPIRPPLMSLMY